MCTNMEHTHNKLHVGNEVAVIKLLRINLKIGKEPTKLAIISRFFQVSTRTHNW